MIIKKSPAEIDKMARAGEILVATLELLEGKVRPGVSTAELDAVAEQPRGSSVVRVQVEP